MLKDNIIKEFYIMSDMRNKDKLYPIRGELEIIGSRGGKIFHYDKGPNMITAWAKHAMMHVLTGESFSNYGSQRQNSLHYSPQFAGDSGINTDGTMVSNYQYFDKPSFPGSLGWWSVSDSILAPATYTGFNYPFFPTKMLFGTGYEYQSWAGDSAYFAKYTSQGFAPSNFSAALINDPTNYYSNIFGGTTGDSILKAKSMNDIYSNTLVTPTVLDSDFAIPGAIKNGTYVNSVASSGRLQIINGNYFSKYDYWGTGYPSFVYARRESRFFQAGTEVALDFDVNIHNKITYTVTLPEQTGLNAGIFYPYNGFTLKVAGIFCDARIFLGNSPPASDGTSKDIGLTEYKNYTKMPGGILVAKRYIAPITKDHSTSITARWTLYL